MEDYSIEVIRDFEGIGRIRPFWEQLQAHPNADVDYYRLVLDGRSQVLQPYVILLSRQGRPVAMMVGRIERKHLPLALGYKKIFSPKVRLLTIIYGGAMGEESARAVEALVGELLATLSRKEAEVILLRGLRADSELFRAATKRPPVSMRQHLSAAEPHWKMALPSTFEKLLAGLSPDHRKDLRRFPRRLEKLFPSQVSFCSYRKKEEIDRFCRDAEDIAKHTYQRGLGDGFVDGPKSRQVLTLWAERGQWRGYVLYVAGEPCAYWIGVLYRDVFHSVQTGYKPAYSTHSPGTVLLARMLEELCREGVPTLDFGQGDALYKQRFAQEGWKETSVYIFGPGLWGALLNALYTATTAADQLADHFLRRSKLLGKVKRVWRDRLRPEVESTGAAPKQRQT